MRYLNAIALLVLCCNQVHAQNYTAKFEYDNEISRKAIVVQQRQIDSVTNFEKIVLDGFDSRIPFYHFENSRTEQPPYIILLHGLSDSKEDFVYPSEPYLDWGRNITAMKDSLLLLGYSLIIPDIKFHGERSYELGFRAPEMLPPVLSKNAEDSKLFETMVTSTVKDLRIIMDYIQRRYSGERLFGVIGYSLGGNLAILLGTFDDRIASIVACVPPINLPGEGIEAFDWPNEVLQGQRDITPMKYAGEVKTPTLLLMGSKDYFYTKEQVSAFIEQIPVSDKEFKFFDSGHILPNEYRFDAIRWVTQHLN